MALNCTDHLLQEHRLILRAISVMAGMAYQADKLKMPGAEDVDELLRFFRHFADEHHQVKEESILFPSLRKSAPGVLDAGIRHLAFEHEQERSTIRGLEEAMHTKSHEDFAYFANRLAETLGSHIKKEENVLFPLADRIVTSESDHDIVTEMTAFDHSLHPGVHDHWIRTVDRLEWKYLNKTTTGA